MMYKMHEGVGGCEGPGVIGYKPPKNEAVYGVKGTVYKS